MQRDAANLSLEVVLALAYPLTVRRRERPAIRVAIGRAMGWSRQSECKDARAGGPRTSSWSHKLSHSTPARSPCSARTRVRCGTRAKARPRARTCVYHSLTHARQAVASPIPLPYVRSSSHRAEQEASHWDILQKLAVHVLFSGDLLFEFHPA